jgi:hypothetical protein
MLRGQREACSISFRGQGRIVVGGSGGGAATRLLALLALGGFECGGGCRLLVGLGEGGSGYWADGGVEECRSPSIVIGTKSRRKKC